MDSFNRIYWLEPSGLPVDMPLGGSREQVKRVPL